MHSNIAGKPGIRDHITAGAVMAAVALALVALLANYLPFPRFEGDTTALFNEVRRMRTALAHGQWTGWGGQFPLLQKLPVLGLQAAGMGDDMLYWVLTVGSLVAFAGTLILAWAGLRRSSRLALLFLAVLLSGPLLWYARSTFGEMLAAFVTLAFVIGCRELAGNVLLVGLFLLAGISKEIAFPFLLLLGFAASTLNMNWREVGFSRSRLWALVLAVALTIGVTAAFTYFRYRSLVNTIYFRNPAIVYPGPRSQMSFFAGIWASPNGGLLFFWPSFCLLLTLSALAMRLKVLAIPSCRERLWTMVPGVAAASTLFALTLGLAKFPFPLGWVAWGPRLMLPWLPSVGYLVLSAYAAELEALVSSAGRLFFSPVTLLVSLASLPQFAVLFRPDLMTGIFAPDAICPTEAQLPQDPAYYYHCINHMLWTKGSTLLGAYSLEPRPSAFLLAGLCSALLFWLLSLARPARVANPAP